MICIMDNSDPFEMKWAHPNDVACYAALIDRTDLLTVLRHVRAPQSPVLEAMIVRRREDLAKVAALFAPQIPEAQSPGAIDARIRRMEEMYNQNLIALATSSKFAWPKPRPEFSVNIDRIHPGSACDVVYLEPYYLVHSPTIELTLDHRDRTRSPIAPESANNKERESERKKSPGPELGR